MQPLKYLAILLATTFAMSANGQAPKAGSLTGSVTEGQQVFTKRCMQCHSVNQGQVMLGPSLYGEMRLSPHKKTAAQVRTSIRDGKGKMPPFKDVLSSDDINNLIAYLATL
jgi:mono/diheme cytochrome c family protein